MLKLKLICIFFVTSLSTCWAQGKNADSLEMVLQQTLEPVERFTVLNELIFSEVQYAGHTVDSAYCIQMLEFLHKDYRSYKKENLYHVTEALIPSSYFKIIPYENNFTFGLELVFTERSAFNELKSYLIQHHIYPSELWPDNTEDKFLLNIHIDFRYTQTDMEHITLILNNWTKSKKNQE